ncbi:MAG: nitrous oxide reductase family maturation protein NosD [Candidatus Thorarchaeota archaeon]
MSGRIRVLFIVLFFILSVNSDTSYCNSNETTLDMCKLNVTSNTYTISEPIQISNDSSFDLLGVSGSGTESDPYIIENYEIEINETSGPYYGIEVSGTQKHFIIRNCYIRGDNTSSSGYGYGIYLRDVSNGQIMSNHLQQIQTLLKIESDTSDLTIKDNYFDGEADSIYRGLLVSGTNENILILNNTFYKIDEAISIFSNGSSIVKNSIVSCERGIILNSCAENIVSENTIKMGMTGFRLEDSDNNLISWNLVTGNSIGGIIEDGSDNNLLTNNSFTSLQQDDESYVQGYGLRIRQTSTNNDIIWNDFIENTIQIKNDVLGNSFDYNYYSDYVGTDADGNHIGDTSYVISGDTPENDAHPRLYLLGEEPSSSTNQVDPMPILLLIGFVGLSAIVIIEIFRRFR